MPVQKSEYHGGRKLYPEDPARYRGLTVTATPAKSEVAEHRDEVFGSQLVLTGFAVRWGKYNGLVLGQAVNAHIQEAAHRQT